MSADAVLLQVFGPRVWPPAEPETPEGRADILRRMHETASVFYKLATRCGSHAFIEFTGILTEYILVCEEAERAGIDWCNANVHSGHRLPMAPYRLAYFSEKLDCIFGLTVVQPEPEPEPEPEP